MHYFVSIQNSQAFLDHSRIFNCRNDKQLKYCSQNQLCSISEHLEEQLKSSLKQYVAANNFRNPYCPRMRARNQKAEDYLGFEEILRVIRRHGRTTTDRCQVASRTRSMCQLYPRFIVNNFYLDSSDTSGEIYRLVRSICER